MLTRHTSCVTRHTSHTTRHTSATLGDVAAQQITDEHCILRTSTAAHKLAQQHTDCIRTDERKTADGKQTLTRRQTDS